MKKLLWIVPALLLVGAGIWFGAPLVSDLLDQAAAPPAQDAANYAPAEPGFGVLKKIEKEVDILNAIAYYRDQNPDAIAWLNVPGLRINDIVMQSYDNNHYLRKNELGEYDLYGSYFADYESNLGSREDMSQNTVIYGHSDLEDNPEGPRFSQLFAYKDEEFANENRYVHFSTYESRMTWQIFAVFETNVSFNYIKTDMTESEQETLLSEVKRLSMYDYGVEVTGTDKILTLSTCGNRTSGKADKRFVVMAKLVPEGTDETAPLPLIIKK